MKVYGVRGGERVMNGGKRWVIMRVKGGYDGKWRYKLKF